MPKRQWYVFEGRDADTRLLTMDIDLSILSALC